MRFSGRDLLKQTVVAGRSMARRRADLSHRTVGLCYHSIHSQKPFATLSPSAFREHIEWLTDHCQVVQFGTETIAGSPADSGDVRPKVMITFDDGYDDNYSVVLPILARKNISATFFITTGFINRDQDTLLRYARERQCSQELLSAMTWDQVRELRDAGMAIGAHTHTHRNLATLTDEAVRAELNISKRILEDELGQPVPLMAYPYGKPKSHFLLPTMELVRKSGYSLAASATARGIRPSDSPFAVPRFFVARDGLDRLEQKVAGDWDGCGWWQEHAPKALQRLTSPTDFSH